MNSLRDLWGPVKQINMCIVVVPVGEERKGQKSYLNTGQNVPKFDKTYESTNLESSVKCK